MFRKLLTLAAIPAATLAFALPASAASHPVKAGTNACAGTAFCGGQTLDSPDLALAVASSHAKAGTALVVAVPAADPRQDFIQAPPFAGGEGTGGPAKYFEWAPSGVPSGLCISQPSTKLHTAFVLRACHAATTQNAFQTFTPEDPASNGDVVWVDNASGLAVADPNGGAAGTGLASRHPGAGTALVELWGFTS
jgi:hypothetical protein